VGDGVFARRIRHLEAEMKRFLFSRTPVLLIFLFAASLTADTLVLRDGRRIEGRLIAVQNGVIEFEDARAFGAVNVVRLNRADVLGIEFDANTGNAAAFPGGRPQGRPSGLRERQVMVPANVRAVDTGIDLRAGQDVYFEATGEVRWRQNRNDGPAGEANSPVNQNRPMPNRPAGALIGRVGDNSDAIFIGNDRGPIRVRGAGRLFLGINDDNLADNSGEFRVMVYY
jgi:hypothetical protein